MHSKKLCSFAAQFVFITSVILTLYQPLCAQGLGRYALPFLTISPSAAANGMGGGFVAASTDASAIYYNPAALPRLGRLALEGNTLKWFPELSDDLRYSYVAGAFQISTSLGLWLGAAYTHIGLGEQVITGELDPTPLGTFKSYEQAFSLAAAKKFGQHLRFGVSFKYLRSVLAPAISNTSQNGDGRASSYAFDIGFLYDGFFQFASFSQKSKRWSWPWTNWVSDRLPPGFSLGVTFANLGPKVAYFGAAVEQPLPQNLRVGLLWNIYNSDDASLIATGQFTKILVKQQRRFGSADPFYKALFTAWSDESFNGGLNQAIYEGGFEMGILRLGAIRVGRRWDGENRLGYNTFGYSIGPPGFRFSYTKISPDDNIVMDTRIYTASIVLDKLF